MRFQRVEFENRGPVNQSLEQWERLGDADILGCGDKIGRAGVFSLRNISPRIAVCAGGQWAGVYVRAGLPLREWPSELKAP
ncbi:hypothetical protein GCM10027265_34640 [Jatrophihabitans fulvus]